MKKYMVNDSKFWIFLLSKILASFVSVSVWGFILVLSAACYLNHSGTIDSNAWALVISIGFPAFLAYRSAGEKMDKEKSND